MPWNEAINRKVAQPSCPGANETHHQPAIRLLNIKKWLFRSKRITFRRTNIEYFVAAARARCFRLISSPHVLIRWLCIFIPSVVCHVVTICLDGALFGQRYELNISKLIKNAIHKLWIRLHWSRTYSFTPAGERYYLLKWIWRPRTLTQLNATKRMNNSMWIKIQCDRNPMPSFCNNSNSIELRLQSLGRLAMMKAIC